MGGGQVLGNLATVVVPWTYTLQTHANLLFLTCTINHKKTIRSNRCLVKPSEGSSARTVKQLRRRRCTYVTGVFTMGSLQSEVPSYMAISVAMPCDALSSTTTQFSRH